MYHDASSNVDKTPGDELNIVQNIMSSIGLNRVNSNQQLMHLMDKIYKIINLEDFGDASLI